MTWQSAILMLATTGWPITVSGATMTVATYSTSTITIVAHKNSIESMACFDCARIRL